VPRSPSGARFRRRRLLLFAAGIVGLAVALTIRLSTSSGTLQNEMWLVGFVFLIITIRGASVVPAWGRLAEGPRTHQAQTRVLDGHSKLVVVRAGGFYKNRLARYGILVDGSSAGSLHEYDRLVVPVHPGTHYVQARIQFFFRSREMVVEVDRHETRHFVVAAGQVDNFPPVPGYIALWEGELQDVLPPVSGPMI